MCEGKVCPKCKEWKPLDEFSTNGFKDGIQLRKSHCKICRNKKASEIRATEEGQRKRREYDQSEAGRKSKRDCSRRYYRSERGQKTREEYQARPEVIERVKAYAQSEKMVEYRKWYNSTSRAKESKDKWENSEAGREYRKNYSLPENSKERVREYCRQYRQSERGRELNKRQREEWNKKNPHLRSYYANVRRAYKIQATPGWVEEEEIKQLYRHAKDLINKTGIQYHIDHIVPLKSEIVCGLHCIANLQILPAEENLKKSNIFWPDMP